MEKKRDYKKEYEEFHGKPKQIKNRAKRNKARKEMEKEGKVKKHDGKEVDHIKPLSKNGGNGKKNVRVISKHSNRVKGDKVK